MTIIHIIAGLYGLSLIGIIYCVFTAPEGVETPQGFRQLDRGQTPDDGGHEARVRDRDIITHHGLTSPFRERNNG